MLLLDRLSPHSLPIPPELQRAFAPAVCCLYEWEKYYLDLPDADALRVGSSWIPPLGNSYTYCLKFENQLGLAEIQPYASGLPLEPPQVVEVISQKFPGLLEHLDFSARC